MLNKMEIPNSRIVSEKNLIGKLNRASFEKNPERVPKNWSFGMKDKALKIAHPLAIPAIGRHK